MNSLAVWLCATSVLLLSALVAYDVWQSIVERRRVQALEDAKRYELLSEETVRHLRRSLGGDA